MIWAEWPAFAQTAMLLATRSSMELPANVWVETHMLPGTVVPDVVAGMRENSLPSLTRAPNPISSLVPLQVALAPMYSSPAAAGAETVAEMYSSPAGGVMQFALALSCQLAVVPSVSLAL